MRARTSSSPGWIRSCGTGWVPARPSWSLSATGRSGACERRSAPRPATSRSPTWTRSAGILAALIHAWHEFAEPHLRVQRPVRGVGEPISAARSADELVECQRHEELLNVAFGSGPGWTLVCPYDTAALDPDVIAECRCSHPQVRENGVTEPSSEYRGLEAIGEPFAPPLPEPSAAPDELAFDLSRLGDVRRTVADAAKRARLDDDRAQDLIVAVHEVAANSVRHGGGTGLLRTWNGGPGVTCEIRDAGVITEPLAGRLRPADPARGGNGLWLANQLCDLVQLRSSQVGTVVRLLVRAPAARTG